MTKTFGGLKPSEPEQLQRAKSFTTKNATVLKANGIPINKASLYAAHLFGAGTAVKVISADGQARGRSDRWQHGKTGMGAMTGIPALGDVYR